MGFLGALCGVRCVPHKAVSGQKRYHLRPCLRPLSPSRSHPSSTDRLETTETLDIGRTEEEWGKLEEKNGESGQKRRIRGRNVRRYLFRGFPRLPAAFRRHGAVFRKPSGCVGRDLLGSPRSPYRQSARATSLQLSNALWFFALKGKPDAQLFHEVGVGNQAIAAEDN